MFLQYECRDKESVKKGKKGKGKKKQSDDENEEESGKEDGPPENTE